MIAPGFSFFDAKDLGEILTGSSQTGAPNRVGVGLDRRFSTNGHSHYGKLIGTRMRSIEWR